MSITKEFIDKLGQLPIPEPTDINYSCFNTGGVECEVGEFLYGLVRMIQPEHILETGTHQGIAGSYMAQALKDNQKGKLDTIEYEQLNLNIARDRFSHLGLLDYIDTHLQSSFDFGPQHNYQIILLDTEPGIRFQEFERFYSYLDPGGIIMIHDLHPNMSQGPVATLPDNWPFGTLPEFIKNKILDHEIQSFHFKTPRGFWVAQRMAPDFHSTKLLNGKL